MKRLFFCLCLLSNFAVATVVAPASPMTAPVGAARATLTLTPDPPSPGRVHAVVVLEGAAPERLAWTSVTYVSSMPAMSMAGPSGGAHRTGPARYEFDLSLGMATTWSVALHFAGGLTGTATYGFAVAGESGGGTAPMAGMSPGSGNSDAWRTAAIALASLILVGAIVVAGRRDRRPLTLAVLAGSVVVVVVLAVVQTKFAAPAMDMSTMSSVEGGGAVPVTLASVTTAPGSSDVHAPGSLMPFLMQDIVVRVPGILTRFDAYAGDRLAAGAVIASLDAPDLRHRADAAAADAAGALDTARAADVEAHHHAPDAAVIASADARAMEGELHASESDAAAKAEAARYWEVELTRERALLDQGAVSLQEYQDERTQAATARAARSGAADKVAALRQQLVAAQMKRRDADATIAQMAAQAAAAHALADKAAAQAATDAAVSDFAAVTVPDDVVVVKRLVDPGVYVQAGTPIARVAVLTRLRLQANVSQNDIAGVTVGMDIEARLPDGSALRGRVTSIGPVADAATHTTTVEAVIRNPRGALVPGGFVTVTLHARSARAAGAVGVPSAAIVGSERDAAVWIDVNGTAHRVAVQLVKDDGTRATVRGDVRRSDRVVVDGAASLQEGQAITEARS